MKEDKEAKNVSVNAGPKNPPVKDDKKGKQVNNFNQQILKLVYLWSKTHRDDSGDNHDDREDKTDDVHISFAVERTFGVLKINLSVIMGEHWGVISRPNLILLTLLKLKMT